jgi:hypothetical protein
LTRKSLYGVVLVAAALFCFTATPAGAQIVVSRQLLPPDAAAAAQNCPISGDPDPTAACTIPALGGVDQPVSGDTCNVASAFSSLQSETSTGKRQTGAALTHAIACANKVGSNSQTNAPGDVAKGEALIPFNMKGGPSYQGGPLFVDFKLGAEAQALPPPGASSGYCCAGGSASWGINVGTGPAIPTQFYTCFLGGILQSRALEGLTSSTSSVVKTPNTFATVPRRETPGSALANSPGVALWRNAGKLPD